MFQLLLAAGKLHMPGRALKPLATLLPPLARFLARALYLTLLETLELVSRPGRAITVLNKTREPAQICKICSVACCASPRNSLNIGAAAAVR